MKELYSSVSPKGQITIPAEIRRLLGVKPRDRVRFEVVAGNVRIAPAPSALDELYQSVPALTPPHPWKEIKEIVRDEQADAAAAEGVD
jgi:AbrB family looped-hinge helix DNA binding protein